MCRAHQVLVWDRRATSSRRMWYSTSSSASPSDNPGTSIALRSNRTVRSSVSPGFFPQVAPRQRDEQMSHRHQAHVMVPADPRPRLVLRHPEVALGVLEEVLDRVACRVQATSASTPSGVAASASLTSYLTSGTGPSDRRTSGQIGGPAAS